MVLNLLAENKQLREEVASVVQDPAPVQFTLRELLYIYQSSAVDANTQSLTRQDKISYDIMHSVYEKARLTLRPWLNSFEEMQAALSLNDEIRIAHENGKWEMSSAKKETD